MGNPTVTPLVETFHDGGFVVSMANGRRSLDQGIIKSGAGKLSAGTVLGQVMTGTATSAAKSGGNTGNGTFVLDGTAPVLANAMTGIYTLRVIEAVTNGGKFQLLDPLGRSLGTYIVVAGAGGTITVADQIKGVLTDGATDFVVGDGFDITVTAVTAKYVPYNPGNTDGSQLARALLWGAVDATSADKAATLVMRHAEVNASELVWDASVNTTAKKNAALVQLAQHGIIGR